MTTKNVLNRRGFLKGAACCAAGLGLQTGVISKVVKAQTAPLGMHLVCIFAAGGKDWLHWLAPVGAAALQTIRPVLMSSANMNQFQNLSGGWALHPGLVNLKSRFDQGKVAFAPMMHYVNSTGSHADSTDQYLRGVARRTNSMMETRGVWVRLAEANNFQSRRSVISVSGTRSIVEPAGRALIGNDLAGFGFSGVAAAEASLPAQTAIQAIALGAAQNQQQADLASAWEAIGADVQNVQQALQARPNYGLNSGLARDLEEAETVIRGFPQQASCTFVSYGGHDTHNNQAQSNANLTNEFDQAVNAFLNSTTDIADQVLILEMSEFGRTNQTNGANSTDHAEATLMTVIGNRVNGGIYAPIPSDALLTRDENSLPMATPDHNHVNLQWEIYSRFLGLQNLASVFPGHNYTRLGLIV